MRRVVLAVAAAAALAVRLGACGGGDSVHNASGGRTIDIDMRDNDFSLASISVKAGEQIQFVFHNKGAVTHEAYIGDEAAQAAHDQQMGGSTGAGHAHGTDSVTVEPGQTETLTHTFPTPSTTIIGCHVLGHYVLGMRIKVNVT